MTETDVREDGGVEVHTAPSGSLNSIMNWLALLTSLFMPVCVNHGLSVSVSKEEARKQ